MLISQEFWSNCPESQGSILKKNHLKCPGLPIIIVFLFFFFSVLFSAWIWEKNKQPQKTNHHYYYFLMFIRILPGDWNQFALVLSDVPTDSFETYFF